MSATPPGWSALHASAVLVGEWGVLLRGPSGAGKSALALALLATAGNVGTLSALVGDDRVFARVCAGRLLARGAPDFAGQIERRGRGVIRVGNEPEAVIRLVADLEDRAGPAPPRLPDEADQTTEILGLRLHRLALDPAFGPLDQAAVVLEALMNRVWDQSLRVTNFA
jgi:serine kinase of HPr protein (carbohydrate metabolism regulator)